MLAIVGENRKGIKGLPVGHLFDPGTVGIDHIQVEGKPAFSFIIAGEKDFIPAGVEKRDSSWHFQDR